MLINAVVWSGTKGGLIHKLVGCWGCHGDVQKMISSLYLDGIKEIDKRVYTTAQHRPGPIDFPSAADLFNISSPFNGNENHANTARRTHFGAASAAFAQTFCLSDWQILRHFSFAHRENQRISQILSDGRERKSL